jgi:hypothetical protein
MSRPVRIEYPNASKVRHFVRPCVVPLDQPCARRIPVTTGSHFFRLLPFAFALTSAFVTILRPPFVRGIDVTLRPFILERGVVFMPWRFSRLANDVPPKPSLLCRIVLVIALLFRIRLSFGYSDSLLTLYLTTVLYLTTDCVIGMPFGPVFSIVIEWCQ